jgi:aspartate/methionine/tyrosine aminotransferase
MAALIRRHGLALVSGSSFGLPGCHLRLSYGMAEEAQLREALVRLKRGLRDLCRGK